MTSSADIARRWVANTKRPFRWRQGMVDAHTGKACSHVCECGCDRPVFMELANGWGPCDLVDNQHQSASLAHRSLPDLDHPGTRAFLLEDVRAAWCSGLGGRPLIVTYGNTGRIEDVCVWQNNADMCVWQSECGGAEALILALEAAP